MKTQIRRNTFETNSSSSHSITISNRGHFDANAIPVTKYYNGTNNCIVLRGGQFGWGIESYTDALTKANYIAVELTLKEDATGYDTYYKMFVDVLKKVTGAKSVVFDFEVDSWDDPNYSYIDHESVGTGFDYGVFDSEDILKHFIFNRGSVLLIDNDNH